MAEQAHSPCRLLIVDDNRDIHADVRKILQPRPKSTVRLSRLNDQLFGDDSGKRKDQTGIDHRFQIHSAFQGQEALQKVLEAKERGEPLMVALVDMRMPPGWDGLETISRIWAEDPMIQTVICTAFSDRSWEDITSKLGHKDRLLILKKPFEDIEIRQMIHALHRKWTLHGQIRDQIENLNQLVYDRTQELENSNQQLKVEIIQRKSAQESLQHLATHDALTGLPNRILLNERTRQAITAAGAAGAAGAEGQVGLLLLDLDGFKAVNDTLGHDYGDEVLTLAAKRIQAVLGPDDTVARLGGDEFVVLLSHLNSAEDADRVARGILDGIKQPMEIRGKQVQVGTSIGVSLYPCDSRDQEVLLKLADSAMYESKRSGKGAIRFHGAQTGAEREERSELVRQLEKAVDNHELRLCYQPLFDAASERVEMMEAMVRWLHPQRGLMKPLSFLPLAEESGTGLEIGSWVLRTACNQGRQWMEAGFESVAMAVNISMRQFLDPGFPNQVASILDESGLPGAQLLLEISASTILRNFGACQKLAEWLSGQDIRLVIDDFGSGVGLMDRLSKLPLYALKISHGLPGTNSDRHDAALAASTLAMAHSLGLRVIAEGIESEQQLIDLKTYHQRMSSLMRFDMVQGYYLAGPLDGPEAARYLQTQGVAP